MSIVAAMPPEKRTGRALFERFRQAKIELPLTNRRMLAMERSELFSIDVGEERQFFEATETGLYAIASVENADHKWHTLLFCFNLETSAGLIESLPHEQLDGLLVQSSFVLAQKPAARGREPYSKVQTVLHSDGTYEGHWV
jgi:hypothetical protein